MARVKCIFCFETGDRAKEHIWPKWIHEFDDTSDSKVIVGRHFGSPMTGLKLLDERTQSDNSFVFGQVCQSCNNGWMSRLESRAMPLLKNAADEGVNAAPWSNEQSRIVAGWAFKTILMINAGTNYRKIVTKVHYRNLYNSSNPPRGVLVEVGLSKSIVAGRELAQSQNLMVLGPEETVVQKNDRHQKRSYVIGLALKHLLLRATYWPDHTASINPDSEMTQLFINGVSSAVDFKKVIPSESTAHLSIGMIVYPMAA
ncbi:hypothetical protein [Rubrivirga marina]|uniref:hypothetical protein n=1 Tax=Rubrivirga marina TaxID=1196024 RepID=UPI00117A7A0E|nr:hypothetical protein [Rubrivirga marina]